MDDHAFPIRYVEPVYRPPSEAQSLILPLTNGCSWNQCTYCDMAAVQADVGEKFGVELMPEPIFL